MKNSTDNYLSQIDPQIAQIIADEKKRQEDYVELIASENYVSTAIMQAQGSVLTNKYAEGYPNKRYYGGCKYVDMIEQIAIDRVKDLFGAEYANVQPHSGSQANQAVYAAVLQPADVILGMSLAHGGHLTHGASVNSSGKLYHAITYGLNSEEEIDYDEVDNLAKKHRPKLIIAGASAYALTIDWQRFRDIADSVAAYLLVDMAHYAGLIAGGVYPNPVNIADFVTSTTHKTLRGPRGGIILAKEKYAKLLNSAIFPGIQGGPLMHVIAAKAVCFKEAAQLEFKHWAQQVKDNASAMVNTLQDRGFRIVSGRTESHVFLIDLQPKQLTGKLAETILESVYITVNKNSIPNDPETPFVTSGIRIGTPAITTRGFRPAEAIQLAHLIADALDGYPNLSQIGPQIAEQVKSLCKRFPVYNNSETHFISE